MDHPTTSVEPRPRGVVSIALVGKPGSGKTTIRKLFEDYGAVSVDLEDYHEKGEIQTGGVYDLIGECIADASESKPRVACIEGVIDESELEWIYQKSKSVLTINVTVSSDAERVDRYIEREVTQRETASIEDELEAHQSIAERELYEKPYPSHDLSIVNNDMRSITELTESVANIISVVSGVDRDDLSCPRTTRPGIEDKQKGELAE